MANFWAGFGQGFQGGFQSAYDRAARRRDLREAREQAKSDAEKLRKDRITEALMKARGESGMPVGGDSAGYVPTEDEQAFYDVGKSSKTIKDQEIERKALEARRKSIQEATRGLYGAGGRLPQQEGVGVFRRPEDYTVEEINALTFKAKESASAKTKLQESEEASARNAGMLAAQSGKGSMVPDRFRAPNLRAAYDQGFSSAAAETFDPSKKNEVISQYRNTAQIAETIFGQAGFNEIESGWKNQYGDGNDKDAIDPVTGLPQYAIHGANQFEEYDNLFNEVERYKALHDGTLKTQKAENETIPAFYNRLKVENDRRDKQLNSNLAVEQANKIAEAKALRENGNEASKQIAIAKGNLKFNPAAAAEFYFPEGEDGQNIAVDIEKLDPYFLAEINERFKDAQEAIQSSGRESESLVSARKLGEELIPQFRQLDAQIREARNSGEEPSPEDLERLTQLGDVIVTFYSTKQQYPEGVKELLANAVKKPTTKIIEDVTLSHEVALVAEEISDDIDFLKGKIGEDRMREFIGIIDQPISNIRNQLEIKGGDAEVEAMRRLKQRYNGVSNRVLRLRSGLAVTESEFNRFVKEIGEPSRADFFRSIQAFAATQRNNARKKFKTMQDAGYVFNSALTESVMGKEEGGSAEATGQGGGVPRGGMSAKERTELETLQGMDRSLMNQKQKDRLNNLLLQQLNQNNSSGK